MGKRWFGLAAAVVMALAATFAPMSAHAQAKPEAAVEVRGGGPVAESRWAGSVTWDNGEAREWTAYFRSDGVLIYGYAGNSYDNGHWGAREQVVWFDTNDHYAVHVGQVRDDVMEGVAYNVAGARAVWRFTRQ